jgi:hypothetical protein
MTRILNLVDAAQERKLYLSKVHSDIKVGITTDNMMILVHFRPGILAWT